MARKRTRWAKVMCIRIADQELADAITRWVLEHEVTFTELTLAALREYLEARRA